MIDFESVDEATTEVMDAPAEAGTYEENLPSGRKDAQSGTGRAENPPRPAALGTLGSDSKKPFENRHEEQESCGNTTEESEKEEKFFPEKLPDVPDGYFQLPDGCSDGAGREVKAARRGPLVEGEIRIGRMFDKRERFNSFRDANLGDLLLGDHPDDTVIQGNELSRFSVVDVDCHDWKTKPSVESLNAIAADIFPEPDAWWITHGLGLKLVYAGPYHRSRSLAAAFCVPSSFTVELLNHTRHPGSSSTSAKHLGSTCGPVHLTGADPKVEFKFHGVGRLTPEARQSALDALDMEDGVRSVR